jgi:putative sterol carrier protein
MALDSNPAFACLTPFLDGQEQQLGKSCENLARVLDEGETACHIHVRLVEGDDTVGSWDLRQGTATASVSADEADVVVVVAQESWIEIAQGRLAPFDAMYSGKLRVGGDLELAKRVTQQLSDPSVPFVAPC